MSLESPQDASGAGRSSSAGPPVEFPPEDLGGTRATRPPSAASESVPLAERSPVAAPRAGGRWADRIPVLRGVLFAIGLLAVAGAVFYVLFVVDTTDQLRADDTRRTVYVLLAAMAVIVAVGTLDYLLEATERKRQRAAEAARRPTHGASRGRTER